MSLIACNQQSEKEEATSNKFLENAEKTRIGTLDFTHDFANGYHTNETVDKLFYEMDFQRACQAYKWAIPYVSFAQWQYSHNTQLGAKNGQIIYFESYQDKLGGLTYNATTPYAIPFIDLGEERPYVVEMPEGEVRGAAHNAWQIGITQITEPGRYLFVGPEQEKPDVKGYKVFVSPTNNLLLGIRLMPESRDERMALLEKIKLYPFSERENPQPRSYMMPQGKPWLAAHPRGMEFWERLADIINRETVHERDRLFLAMLKPLGIERDNHSIPQSTNAKY